MTVIGAGVAEDVAMTEDTAGATAEALDDVRTDGNRESDDGRSRLRGGSTTATSESSSHDTEPPPTAPPAPAAAPGEKTGSGKGGSTRDITGTGAGRFRDDLAPVDPPDTTFDVPFTLVECFSS
jgi:hypothetical protein